MWERVGEEFILSPYSKRYQDPTNRKPIEEFLKIQGRFSRLFRPTRNEQRLKEIQDFVQHRWDVLLRTFT
jgi:pyruvate ferredoxin oxidoreductase beta subunit